LLIAPFLLLFAQTPIGSCGTGKITWYTDIANGHCSFGPPTGNMYIAALNTAFYNKGVQCGSCYKLTGPLGSVVVTVTDECPAATNQEWCTGDHNHFDLSVPAFNQIAKDNVNITYERVTCPVPGNIQYFIKDGSNKYWFALLANQLKVQITKLEVMQPGST